MLKNICRRQKKNSNYPVGKELKTKHCVILQLQLLFTVKPALSSHSKEDQKLGFQFKTDTVIILCRSKVLQNAPVEHPAILLTCIKLLLGFKTIVLSIFEWPLKTGFNVLLFCCCF